MPENGTSDALTMLSARIEHLEKQNKRIVRTAWILGSALLLVILLAVALLLSGVFTKFYNKYVNPGFVLEAHKGISRLPLFDEDGKSWASLIVSKGGADFLLLNRNSVESNFLGRSKNYGEDHLLLKYLDMDTYGSTDVGNLIDINMWVSGSFSLFDENINLRVLFIYVNNGKPYLAIFDDCGKPRAGMTVYKGETIFSIFNNNGDLSLTRSQP